MTMKHITDILHSDGYSCVILKGKDIRTFSQPGVADLYDLLKGDTAFLKGASVADKVVGKAAAALMILGGVKEIYTDLISLPALMLLGDSDIKVHYEHSVPFIQNRDKSGWCPLETICYQEKSPAAMLPLIDGFIHRMRNAHTVTQSER